MPITEQDTGQEPEKKSTGNQPENTQETPEDRIQQDAEAAERVKHNYQRHPSAID